MSSSNGNGRLREVLEDACAEEGCSLKDLTVLAAQRDPYRLDTPANHRDGEWLATHLGDRVIHSRGIHYMLTGVRGLTKPDGKPFTNTESDWVWLSEKAIKAARWLGYVSFEQISDERNVEPIERIFKWPDPVQLISAGLNIEIPPTDEIEPQAAIRDFRGVQPYKLVVFGEKTSLEPVLAPVCENRQADLYLPKGEISDTQIYRMARVGAADGRRMVVLTFSDSDPSGWQMPISIAHKLQAFKDLEFPELEFEVRRVALVPDQVREYGLPSDPMKHTEKRGPAWRAAMKVDQTEIDALATLQPELLRRIAYQATRPFFDTTLAERVAEARREWLQEAQARFEEQIGPEQLAEIRAAIELQVDQLAKQVDALNEAARIDMGDEYDMPEVVIPEPEITVEPDGLPLVDSDWGFAEQTIRLIRSRRYVS